MTSIEWLWEQIDNLVPYQDINTAQQFNGLLEQAKEMHKKEIIDAHGEEQSYLQHDLSWKRMNGEQYYQETFVSKGSDFKQFSLYEHKDTITSADTIPFPQQDVDKFEKFLDNEIAFGLSPKDRIERIKWYYQTYFKAKETLYTEKQVREAMKFARTFNSAIRDIDYIKSLKQGGDK